MKTVTAILMAASLLWSGEFYLVDGGTKTALARVTAPDFDTATRTALPHVQRSDATITLRYEGEGYNHRHLNVRLSSFDARPVHTVLTEYSETLAPGVHRITFDGYRVTEACTLEAYYRGEWHVIVLDSLEQ